MLQIKVIQGFQHIPQMKQNYSLEYSKEKQMEFGFDS